jgi:hypothetical protein
MFPISRASSAMVESNPYYNTFSPLHFCEAYPQFHQLNPHHDTFSPLHPCEASPRFQQPNPYTGSSNVHTTPVLHRYGVPPYDPQPLPHDGGSGIDTMSCQDGAQIQHPLQTGDHTVESASTFHQTSPASASKEALFQNTPQQTAYASSSGTQHHRQPSNSLKHSDRPLEIARNPPRQEWDPSYRLVHAAIDEEEVANHEAFIAHREHQMLQISLRTKYAVDDPTVDMKTWLDSKIDLPRRRGQSQSKFKQVMDWRLLVNAMIAEKAADAKFKEKHEAAAQLHGHAVNDTKGFEY